VEVAGRIMPEEYGKREQQQVSFEWGPFLAELCRKVSSGALDAEWASYEKLDEGTGEGRLLSDGQECSDS